MDYDIFETTDLRELIIKTIYWGYTGGMRGNHFVNIFMPHITYFASTLVADSLMLNV